MPIIREYHSKEQISGGLQASDRGVSALGAAASENSATAGATAALGRSQAANAAVAGNAIAEGVNALAGAAFDLAEQHYTKKETLAYGRDSAILRADLTAKWNKFRNDPANADDPNATRRFNEEVLQPALTEFGKGYITKTGEQLAASFRTDMAHDFAMRQEADERIIAAQQAETNLVTQQNADAASLHTDPSNLFSINNNVDKVIGTYKRVSGLSAEQAAHLDDLGRNMKRTNTLAAGKGMADANPVAFQKLLADGFGKEHLTPEDNATLFNYARDAEQREISRKRADETWQKQRDADEADAVLVQLTTQDLIKPDGSLGPNPDFFTHLRDAYTALPGATSASYRAALGFAQSLQENYDNKFVPVTDPSTYSVFMDDMVRSPDDPKALTAERIYTAAAERRLSQRETTFFMSAVTNIQKDPEKRAAYSQFNEWANSLKGDISRSVLGGVRDGIGEQAFFQFKNEARQEFDRRYKEGTWREAITASKNPTYLGHLAEPWKTSPQEQMRRLQGMLDTVAPVVSGPLRPELHRPQVNLPQVDLNRKPGPPAPNAVQSPVDETAARPGETAAEYIKRRGL